MTSDISKFSALHAVSEEVAGTSEILAAAFDSSTLDAATVAGMAGTPVDANSSLELAMKGALGEASALNNLGPAVETANLIDFTPTPTEASTLTTALTGAEVDAADVMSPTMAQSVLGDSSTITSTLTAAHLPANEILRAADIAPTLVGASNDISPAVQALHGALDISPAIQAMHASSGFTPTTQAIQGAMDLTSVAEQMRLTGQIPKVTLGKEMMKGVNAALAVEELQTFGPPSDIFDTLFQGIDYTVDPATSGYHNPTLGDIILDELWAAGREQPSPIVSAVFQWSVTAVRVLHPGYSTEEVLTEACGVVAVVIWVAICTRMGGGTLETTLSSRIPHYYTKGLATRYLTDEEMAVGVDEPLPPLEDEGNDREADQE
ncbi:hypothetical protein [Halomarina oriensis]|uniref:Uncharacterized protein n=1 Tax=Halomarina oriensis TaxID=671145 RepID=A0A6B0GSC7_9EURY|nr:hypothetical protein [Halomarina oriensis]MWG36217.1 hypothetical protein [Halomarina oriensis]